MLLLLTHALAKSPNLLVILADDQDYASMEHFPALRQALSGASFSNSFVSLSLCCPSRASLLTGQYAHSNGVLSNGGKDGGFVAMKRCEDHTVAKLLHDAGYRTGLFGKYVNKYPETEALTYIPSGWDSWAVPVEGSGYVQYNYTLNHNGSLEHYRDASEDYLTDVLARLAQDFISADAEAPFFALVAPFAPHTPATVAPRHQSSFQELALHKTTSFNESDISDKHPVFAGLSLLDNRQISELTRLYRKRLGSIKAIEELVVGLVEKLEKTDQLANTWIFYTSDNGFHLGQHRLPSGKNTAFDEDLHVPFLVRGPGVVSGELPALMVNTDIAPTLMELAGLSLPSWVEGRSLVPWLTGQTPAQWRAGILLEHFRVADREGDKHKENPPSFAGIRTLDWKYIAYSDGVEELFDLRADPAELENVAGVQTRLVAEFSEWLGRLKSCKGESCRAIEQE
jgi:arylsulfatase A-like enzyme